MARNGAKAFDRRYGRDMEHAVFRMLIGGATGRLVPENERVERHRTEKEHHQDGKCLNQNRGHVRQPFSGDSSPAPVFGWRDNTVIRYVSTVSHGRERVGGSGRRTIRSFSPVPRVRPAGESRSGVRTHVRTTMTPCQPFFRTLVRRTYTRPEDLVVPGTVGQKDSIQASGVLRLIGPGAYRRHLFTHVLNTVDSFVGRNTNRAWL